MRRRILFLLMAFAAAAAAGPAPAHAAPLGPYTIRALGLTDAEHTRSDGYRSGYAFLLNESGLVGGFSQRFSGASELGYSSWIFDSASATTTRLGYFDAAHTRSDGYQSSNIDFLTNSGLAAGFSDRFSGASAAGRSAWLYDSASATTTRLGYFDADHTGDGGQQVSYASDLTESGLAVGESFRFIGISYEGSSAWIYDRSSDTTTRIGLMDADHTDADGYHHDFAYQVNESGLVVGISGRYIGAAYAGPSAWIHDSAAATTTRIGLFDAAHTRSDGYTYSDVYHLSDAGLAAGHSSRFSGANQSGESAWVYDSASDVTTRVGFFDAAHTASDGTQGSFVDLLDETGRAAGRSERYGAAGYLGESAWIYDSASATTTRVGFFDADHTGSDGYQASAVGALNDTGLAVGSSERRTGTTYMGQSAWLHDAASATTTRIGLLDALHTSSDGIQESWVGMLTDAGLAAGGSARYAGMDWNGEDAWIYDAASDTQYSITLSTRSDGYAISEVRFLAEDGLALGSYELFDALDNELGPRAFAWTAADGAVDLGALVQGGLGAAGWSYLAESIRANGIGQILGYGQLGNGSDLPYLLTQVPEPGTGSLLLGGLLGLAARRRRRARRGA